jgi:aminotransferase in exopolysaccharide biosynthesis
MKINSIDFVNQVVDAIRSVVGTKPVGLHEPTFDGNEWKYLKECLDSSYVSSVGKFVDQFEEKLAEYTGSKFAISVVNGTSALHIALKLAGVQPGDEVLVPELTFVATANAVSYCGATPHFVDSEERTLGIDASKLRSYLNSIVDVEFNLSVNKITGKVIRAIVPMHTYGHPSDLDGLLSISRDFNIVLVEDAAESLGSFYRGKHTGTFGLLSVTSFNGNKTITTGGGGAILTNDQSLAKRAKHLTTTAKKTHQWEYDHDEIGYNYRMPNINAALGCAQLEKLNEKLEKKRELFTRYQEAFRSISGVNLVHEPQNCQSNYWLQTILLEEHYSQFIERILESSNYLQISTRPSWKLINELKIYENAPSMGVEIATSLSKRLINLPSSSKIL